MKFAKDVTMIFDIVELTYDRFVDGHVRYSQYPVPSWLLDARSADESFNKISLYDNGTNIEADIFDRTGTRHKVYLPVTLSWNPIFGLEIVKDSPFEPGIHDWKRVWW